MDANVNKKIVHHLVVDAGPEFDQVVAYLPRVVAEDLVRTLDAAGEAFRYDANSQRAYFLRRQGAAVNVWSWDNIQSPGEYGDLIALIMRLDIPFDLEQATKVYLGATGRSAIT
ncbi:MAG TPA: hypothetical protein VJM31_00890 [Vicinamibacterales bacterium]|nr:hypothetical protein [Vicinamibacterales bacterium]